MSGEICPMNEELIEERVKYWKREIVRCLQTPTIISQLAAQNIIDEDTQTKLRQLYTEKTTDVAANELINAIRKSAAPKRWSLFIECLHKEGLVYVKSLLLAEHQYEDEERERGRKMIKFFSSTLEKNIDPIDILSTLIANDVIAEHDSEEIRNLCLNKSRVYAAMCLLDRIQCRLRPGEWYYHFLCALRDNDYEEEVKLLEPDLLDDPSKYLPTNQHGRKKIAVVQPATRMAADNPIDKDGDSADNQNLTHSKHVFKCVLSNNEPMETIPIPVHEIMGRNKTFMKATYKHEPESGSMVNTQQASTVELPSHLIEDVTTSLKQVTIGDTTPKATQELLLDTPQTPLVQLIPEYTQSYSQEADEDTQEADEDTQGMDQCEDITGSEFKLREYQKELSENAVKGLNTIICAETGTGKTYVALNIIKKHLADTSKGERRVVFMARTNVLIQQQFQTLTKRLPSYQIKLISGESDDANMLAAFIPNNHILCLTPQILVNNIEKGTVHLSDFSLLVLDECHHTSGNVPYANIGRRYLMDKKKNVQKLPQIVGLTASIGIGKSRTDNESVNYIMKLCSMLDCQVLSTVQKHETEYLKWCNIPKEERINLTEKDRDPCREAVDKAIRETEYILEQIVALQPELVDVLLDKRPRHDRKPEAYYKWALKLQKHARLHNSTEDDLRDVGSCARYLLIFLAAFEVNKLLQTKHIIKYLADAQKVESQGKDRLTEREKELFEIFKEVQMILIKASKGDEENPNVRTLSAQLRQMLNDKGDDSRAMVFVQARATCKALAEVLDLEFKDVRINVHYLFGQDTRGSITGMSRDEQTNTLDKFKEGHYKILVCTSVGIEGLDVPDCNIVINYNYAGNEITKVQMRGRTRKSDATHVTIASKHLLQRDEVNIYKVNMMYNAMKQILQMDPTTFRHNIQHYQGIELNCCENHMEDPKKRITAENDFTISCFRCNATVCQASDIHQYESNHFVVDPTFAVRVKLVEHRAQQRFAGILKRYKMHCKLCPLDWGIVAERGEYLLYIIKLENLKFKNNRTEAISFFKKWSEVPFDFPKHDLNDIPSLLAYQINIE